MSETGEAKAQRTRRLAIARARRSAVGQSQCNIEGALDRASCGASVLAFAVLIAAGTAAAALPREIARVFLNTGVPLNAVAIVVQDVSNHRPLFTQQPDRPYNPASVMKLVTTFAALELLGPEFHWTTTAYLDGPLDAGVLRGNLVLKGGGDPKLTLERWQAFMTMLRDKGLSSVEGDLVLDRTFFAPATHDPAAFDGEPRKPYNVGPDALLVNFKSVKFAFAPGAGDDAVATVEPSLRAVAVGAPPKLVTGSCGDWRATIGASFLDQGTRAEVTFAGPYPASCGERDWWVSLLDHPTYVHAMFDTYFGAAGGRFAGRWRDGVAPARATPFATFDSPPLWDVVRDINKLSNNVMARQVFLTLATAQSPPPATIARATETVAAWAARRNLKMPELVLENGSGLSRRERISAGSLARLLLAANASPVREEFASSLSVAAMDGTLQRRFVNGSVAGQALLKTGTLDGVRALAGYVINEDGRRFAVVAIVNHAHAAQTQGALDYLVQWVYRSGASWQPTR